MQSVKKKAQDVRVYDVTSLTPFMDSMIVCSTTNIRQNNAIAQNIKDRLREAGYMGICILKVIQVQSGF